MSASRNRIAGREPFLKEIGTAAAGFREDDLKSIRRMPVPSAYDKVCVEDPGRHPAQTAEPDEIVATQYTVPCPEGRLCGDCTVGAGHRSGVGAGGRGSTEQCGDRVGKREQRGASGQGWNPFSSGEGGGRCRTVKGEGDIPQLFLCLATGMGAILE